VKILIDMNLTPKWREPLEAAGHKITHWSEIGPANAPDTDLMAWAPAERSHCVHEVISIMARCCMQQEQLRLVSFKRDVMIRGLRPWRILFFGR